MADGDDRPLLQRERRPRHAGDGIVLREIGHGDVGMGLESASTCAAQMLASQRRPGRRTICKADTAPVAKGYPALMRNKPG